MTARPLTRNALILAPTIVMVFVFTLVTELMTKSGWASPLATSSYVPERSSSPRRATSVAVLGRIS